MKDNYKIFNIQKIKTKEGYMFPIYKNWETDLNESHQPKMVYVTTIEPFLEKDIILHEKRVSYITCIQGDVKLTMKVKDNIVDCSLYDKENNCPNVVLIDKNIPIKLTNVGKENAIIVNCPSPSWHPDDEDTIKFKTWEEYDKWVG